MGALTLDQWLSDAGVTSEAFAEIIGVSKVSVGRYRHGDAMPRPSVAQKIVTATDGAVTIADLHRSVVQRLGIEAAA